MPKQGIEFRYGAYTLAGCQSLKRQGPFGLPRRWLDRLSLHTLSIAPALSKKLKQGDACDAGGARFQALRRIFRGHAA
jgi:hypothetical protein